MSNIIVKNAFTWALFDRVTTQGIMAVVSIILARIIAPSQYGIISLALIIVVFGDAFVNPGICSALVQKKEPDNIDYSTIFWFNMLLSIVLFLLFFIAAPFVEQFYNIPQLGTVIRVLALKFPFGALASIQNAFVQKNFLFKKYFFVSLFGTLAAGILGIYMALNGTGVWALVVYNLGNCAVDSLLALFFINWKPIFCFSKERFKGLFAYGNKIFLVKIIDLFYEQLSGLFIGKRYSSRDLALYDRGKKFPDMIISVVSNSLSDTLFPTFSSIQDDSKKTRQIVCDSIAIVLYVVMPCMFGLFACSETFVTVILTDKWVGSVPFLRIMCINFLCIPIATILLQSIKATGRSDIVLKLEVAKKIYSLSLLIIAFAISKNALLVSAGLLVSTMISLLVDIIVAKKMKKIDLLAIIKDNYKTCIITAFMLAAVYAVDSLHISLVVKLALQIIIGSTIYIGISAIIKPKAYLYIVRNYLVVLRRKRNG